MKSIKPQSTTSKRPKQSMQKQKKPKKPHHRSISTTSTQSTTHPLSSHDLSAPETVFNAPNKLNKSPLITTRRSMSGCASSSCGCDDTPQPTEQELSEQQSKTLDKMRKQQRDFSLRLYRGILRQHRNLPPEMRMVGDPYVKEEFRLHKNAKPEHLQPFYEQWIEYLGHLRENFNNVDNIGRYIQDDMFNTLNDEQKEKLVHMYHETQRLFGPEGDFAENAKDVSETYQNATSVENALPKVGIQTTSVNAQV